MFCNTDVGIFHFVFYHLLQVDFLLPFVDSVINQRRLQNIVKVRIHGAILRAMAKLHRVSTPKIVARNIAAVEFRPTSATLRATNFFVYPPSAAFRAIL